MSLSTALIPYVEPKPAAQFVAEQAMSEQQIMVWEKHIAQTCFFYGWTGSPTGGHAVQGQITAAEKTAAIVVQLFDGVLFPPVAKLVTHYIGYDYGVGYDFRFVRISPDGTAQFRVVEAIDHDEDCNVFFGGLLWDGFGIELLNSEAFEAEKVARDAAQTRKWATLLRLGD